MIRNGFHLNQSPLNLDLLLAFIAFLSPAKICSAPIAAPLPGHPTFGLLLNIKQLLSIDAKTKNINNFFIR